MIIKKEDILKLSCEIYMISVQHTKLIGFNPKYYKVSMKGLDSLTYAPEIVDDEIRIYVNELCDYDLLFDAESKKITINKHTNKNSIYPPTV